MEVIVKRLKLFALTFVLALCCTTIDAAGDESGRPAATASAQGVSRPPAAKPLPDLPSDAQATSQIEAGFVSWASTWMYDRYLPTSARILERGFKDDVYVIRGTFDFARFGSRLTIPFAAAFTKGDTGGANYGTYAISNLCYNDTSSGITDCINPTASMSDRRAAVMQSRQTMGAIVALGLLAAMSETSGSTERNERNKPNCGYEQQTYYKGPSETQGGVGFRDVWVCH